MREVKDSEIENLSDGLKHQPVYNVIRRAERTFARISPNIPQVFRKNVTEIHWLFAYSGSAVSHAGEEFGFEKKFRYLQAARDALFDSYHYMVSIIDGGGLTPGAANEVIVHIRDAHSQVCAWQSSEIRNNGCRQGGNT